MLTWCRHTQDPSDSGILAVVGLDGYLQRPNTCPDRAVPPDDEELSHTHTLVRVKNTTRIVPTVVTSRVHCAMGKNFSFSSRLRSIYYLITIFNDNGCVPGKINYRLHGRCENLTGENQYYCSRYDTCIQC